MVILVLSYNILKSYFRINSLINKYGNEISDFISININRDEQNIIKNILEFPKIIQESFMLQIIILLTLLIMFLN